MLVWPTKSFIYTLYVGIINMDDLLENIKTILNSADLVYDKKDFTSATILYFKAIFTALDYLILKSEGKTPKDHSERFSILKESFPDLYEFLDKYFDTYRNTYSTKIDKETCDEVRKNVKDIIKKYKILVWNKWIL